MNKEAVRLRAEADQKWTFLRGQSSTLEKIHGKWQTGEAMELFDSSVLVIAIMAAIAEVRARDCEDADRDSGG